MEAITLERGLKLNIPANWRRRSRRAVANGERCQANISHACTLTRETPVRLASDPFDVAQSAGDHRAPEVFFGTRQVGHNSRRRGSRLE